MKILTVNHSDSVGPAAQSAHRLHRALLRRGIESEMWVNHEGTDDWTVAGPASSSHKLMSRAAPLMASQLLKLHKSEDAAPRSLATIPSAWVDRINASDADVVHLHWVYNEMLTIEAIGRIAKPIVWTLHDMWPFCGAEHFPADDRWRIGYTKSNRPSDQRGFDVDRWAWNRKVKAWRRPFHLIAPTQWLGDAARDSALMRSWPVSIIPNAVDTDAWTPIEKSNARRLLNLSDDLPVVALGAWSYAAANEGYDLLKTALQNLRSRDFKLQLLVVGQNAPKDPVAIDYPIRYAGPLRDELSLRIAYSAADIFAVPSRMESFCESAAEAQSCGTPIVAFDSTGMHDMVEHRVTGYSASPFDADDLARGIEWIIATRDRRVQLGQQARTKAIENYSYAAVAEKHAALYGTLIATTQSRDSR